MQQNNLSFLILLPHLCFVHCLPVVNLLTRQKNNLQGRRSYWPRNIAKENSSLVFKINDHPERTVVRSELTVDGGATSYIIKDVEKILIYDSLRPENHFLEQADGIRTIVIASKWSDAEIFLVHKDRNHAIVSLKRALYIPSYPKDIFSLKSAQTN